MPTDTLIASGSSRDVFALDSQWVRKVNRPVAACKSRRPDANTREYRLWKNVSTTPDAQYFAAVIPLPDGSVLQERAVTTVEARYGFDWSKPFAHFAPDLIEVMDRLDIDDCHPSNVGIFPDGFQKMIDYAGECCSRGCWLARR